jgi:hypothetical protein
MDALERIEVALRVDIAHTLGKLDIFAYLKPELFHHDFSVGLDHETGVSRQHEWLGKHAQLIRRSKEEFVRHNKGKYGPPIAIWVACEVWDFGTLSTLFSGMREAEQDAISRQYDVGNGRVFAFQLARADDKAFGQFSGFDAPGIKPDGHGRAGRLGHTLVNHKKTPQQRLRLSEVTERGRVTNDSRDFNPAGQPAPSLASRAAVTLPRQTSIITAVWPAPCRWPFSLPDTLLARPSRHHAHARPTKTRYHRPVPGRPRSDPGRL